MENNNIKNVIFDISEVLLTGIKDTGIALGEKHKLTELIKHRVGWTQIKTPLLIPKVDEFFHGKINEDEYIQAVLNEFPQLGEVESLKSHIRENFKEIEGTREIIIKLKQLGYTLALLSVHTKEWVDYCEEKFDFHKLFDVRVYSYDIKASKPDPKSFLCTLEKLSAKPEECLFIDDSNTNVKAAEALGIKSVLFTTAEDLEIKLEEILPNFKIPRN